MRYRFFLYSLFLVLLSCALIAPVSPIASAEAKGKRHRSIVSPPAIPAQSTLQVVSAILYDMDGERILFEQNADQRIQPASLTKVLSMFVAMDHVQSGHARLGSVVPISENAAGTGGSVMGIRQSDTVTLEQLLMGMAVSSGNDASAAVAEYVGGSEATFVRMMNAKAARLGMANSNFCTPHGLPEVGQYTSARDMLTLARAYLRAYPQNLRYHNTRVLNHQNRISWNRNPLLAQYEGADGLKTGWVRASGFNLISTAKRDGHRLLAVVLGAHDAGNRGVETCRLLDAGFQVIGGGAPSVAVALEHQDKSGYAALDIHRNAQEARALYPTALEARPLGRSPRLMAGGRPAYAGKTGKARKAGRNMGKNAKRQARQKGTQAQKSRHTARNKRQRAADVSAGG